VTVIGCDSGCSGQLGLAEGLPEGGDGDALSGFRLGATDSGGGEGGFGVDELGGEGEALFEAGPGEFGAFLGLVGDAFGDLESLLGFLEVESGLGDLEFDSELEFALLFGGHVERGLGFADAAAAAVAIPEVPLEFDSGGIAVAAAVEFPAVIIIVSAEGIDRGEISAAGAAECGFGGEAQLGGGFQFESCWWGIGGRDRDEGGVQVEIAVQGIEGKQIGQGALGEGVGIAGSDEIFAGFGESDFDIEHFGFEGGAAGLTFSGRIEAGFEGVDGGFTGLDESAGLLEGEEGAGDFEGDALSDGEVLVASGGEVGSGGAFGCLVLAAAVEGYDEQAVDVEIVGVGNIGDEAEVEGILVEGGAEDLHGVVGDAVTRVELEERLIGGVGLFESGDGGGDSVSSEEGVGIIGEGGFHGGLQSQPVGGLGVGDSGEQEGEHGWEEPTEGWRRKLGLRRPVHDGGEEAGSLRVMLVLGESESGTGGRTCSQAIRDGVIQSRSGALRGRIEDQVGVNCSRIWIGCRCPACGRWFQRGRSR